MKKLLCIIFVFSALCLTAYAGDVPEGLLHEDNAQLFFAEVIEYNLKKEVPNIEISPVKKIKGDVKLGTKQIYLNPERIGGFNIEIGETYLFSYYDEVNPTYVFKTTNLDTKTLKLVGTHGDMWERLEKYINHGEFEEAELERIGRVNEALTEEGDKIDLLTVMGTKRASASGISVMINGEKYPLDKNKFFDLAENTVLTDIKNTAVDHTAGFYISADNDPLVSIFISDKATVSRWALTSSSFPTGDYSIKSEDLAKLYSLIPEEARENLPELPNPYKKATPILVLTLIAVGAVGFGIGYKLKKK